MRYYNELFIWENRRYIQLLIDYQEVVIGYFVEIQAQNGYESEESLLLRAKINLMTESVAVVSRKANVSTTTIYTAPPVAGGRSRRIDLIANVFMLAQYGMSPQEVIDVTHRAMGVYENDQRSSLIRTFNPFYWLYLFISVVLRMPFYLLKAAGFNQNKIEGSIFGKVFKGVVAIAGLFFTIVQISEKLGLLKSLKNLLGI